MLLLPAAVPGGGGGGGGGRRQGNPLAAERTRRHHLGGRHGGVAGGGEGRPGDVPSKKKHFFHKYIIFKKLMISKDILRYLREEEFTHLSGILWCVIPNVRRDAALQRQARFIHRMARWDGGGGGRSIW